MNHKELAIKIADCFTPQKDWHPHRDSWRLFNEDSVKYQAFMDEWKRLNVKYKQRFYTDRTSRDMALVLIEKALATTEHIER